MSESNRSISREPKKFGDYIALCGHSQHKPAWHGNYRETLQLADADAAAHLSDYPDHEPFTTTSIEADNILREWQIHDKQGL
ncbi:hypothetical protein [Pseudomonas sp.]|uniref:hypothetical protein n=1 Tax=Pseudomonas sp. TaxID=306 RepID=UPI003F400DBD